MSQDNRENFGVKILDQHWRVTGESGRGGGGVGRGGGRERRKEKTERVC